MKQHEVALGVDNIRSLRQKILALQRAMREEIGSEVTSVLGARVREDVIDGIPTDVRDMDGNYLGVENADDAVTVKHGIANEAHVFWRGEQIAFIEYGTGASGASAGYPGVMAPGYSPDPTKALWVYKDAKFGPVLSRGITPYAPMYQAALLARHSGYAAEVAKPILRGALDAVAV